MSKGSRPVQTRLLRILCSADHWHLRDLLVMIHNPERAKGSMVAPHAAPPMPLQPACPTNAASLRARNLSDAPCDDPVTGPKDRVLVAEASCERGGDQEGRRAAGPKHAGSQSCRAAPGSAGAPQPATSQATEGCLLVRLVTDALVDGHFPHPQVVGQRVPRPRQHEAAAAGPAAPVLLAAQQHVRLQLPQLGCRLLRLRIEGCQ